MASANFLTQLKALMLSQFSCFLLLQFAMKSHQAQLWGKNISHQNHVSDWTTQWEKCPCVEACPDKYSKTFPPLLMLTMIMKSSSQVWLTCQLTDTASQKNMSWTSLLGLNLWAADTRCFFHLKTHLSNRLLSDWHNNQHTVRYLNTVNRHLPQWAFGLKVCHKNMSQGVTKCLVSLHILYYFCIQETLKLAPHIKRHFIQLDNMLTLLLVCHIHNQTRR